MAETKIEWARWTFNPWRGCTKVSPGCDFCYAEALSKRNPKVLGVWGDDGTRVVAAESYWRAPLKWNAEAAASGVRERVFCASLADVFEDRPELEAPRGRLWRLILDTPALDWLLLTKRPENVTRMTPGWFNGWPPNAWLGTTAEDQQRADERIPILLRTCARVKFISAEPLLGPVDLRPWLSRGSQCDCGMARGTMDGCEPRKHMIRCNLGLQRLTWLIVGGESGHAARTFDIQWARDILTQCRTAGVACFVKQFGSNPDNSAQPDGTLIQAYIRDKKGGNPDEWPEDLRVREFPVAVA